MTRDETIRRFRPRLLLIATDAWALRKEQPSALGMALDNHVRQLDELIGAIWDAAQTPQPNKPAANGAAGGKTHANVPRPGP